MSTATTIAIASSIQSSIAMSKAMQAEKEACKAEIKTYDAKIASVVEMKNYASCVEKLYPSEMSTGDILIFKAILIVAFIGMIAGAIKGYDLEEKIMFGLFGFLLLPFVIGFIIALGFGALWILGVI